VVPFFPPPASRVERVLLVESVISPPPVPGLQFPNIEADLSPGCLPAFLFSSLLCVRDSSGTQHRSSSRLGVFSHFGDLFSSLLACTLSRTQRFPTACGGFKSLAMTHTPFPTVLLYQMIFFLGEEVPPHFFFFCQGLMFLPLFL